MKAIRWISLFMVVLFCGFALEKSSAGGQTEPQLGFPWKEGDLWRFSGGTHHYLGEGVTRRSWSALDFVPTSYADGNNIVRAVADGVVFDVRIPCWVIVKHADNWFTRYLHVSSIVVKERDPVARGQEIATISPHKWETCHLEDPHASPHLHLDLMKDIKMIGDRIEEDSFVDFNGHYIGGYLVKDAESIYDGPLVRNGVEFHPKSGGSIYIKNQGWVGEGLISDTGFKPILPVKDYLNESVILCTTSLDCSRIDAYEEQHEVRLVEPILSNLKLIMPTKTRHIDFIGKQEIGSPKACVDFDIQDLRMYRFPNTDYPINTNTKIAYVRSGKCVEPRVQRTGEINESLEGRYVLLPKDINGCQEERDGVYFSDDRGYCLASLTGSWNEHMVAYSMSFTPNQLRSKHWSNEAKYHVQLFNKEGQCQVVNLKGNTTVQVNYQIPLPIHRVEVYENKDTRDCTDVYPLSPDFPTLQYLSRAGSKLTEPPPLIWFISAKDNNAKVFWLEKHSGLVLDDIDDLKDYEGRIYFPRWSNKGIHNLQIVSSGTSLNAGSNTLTYEVVNDVPFYVGFIERIYKLSDNKAESFNIKVEPKEIGYIYGKTLSINGIQYESQDLTAASILTPTQKIYVLTSGTYTIDWSNGSLLVGEDKSDQGHLDYLIQRQQATTSREWHPIFLDENIKPTPTQTPSETPIPTATQATPTSEPTPTGTLVTTPTSTPIATTTPQPTHGKHLYLPLARR